jgi:ankyrin repeat protein
MSHLFVVNLQSKNFKQTPLIVATYYQNLKALELLINSGKANISLRDASGDFALHYAAKQGAFECIKLLLPEKAKKYPLKSLLHCLTCIAPTTSMKKMELVSQFLMLLNLAC